MNSGKENLLKRIENVQRIVKENYEPGNQNKCKLQAYRKYVMPVYPMCERTFWNYLSVGINDKKERKKEHPGQLEIDFFQE
jgi:hypothetical protein